ncbi:MAG: hypothetical protein GX666_02220 [Tissierellia bacterium]|nr:hypothetical protein [Tissierellia bacterium]
MSDYKEIKPNPENVQEDLDTNAKFEGVYFMPGSSNYVPTEGMKVYMVEIKSVEEVSPPQVEQPVSSPKEDFEDTIIMDAPIQEEYIPESPKYEEPYQQPTYQDKVYEPPTQPEQPRYEEQQGSYQATPTYQEQPQYNQQQSQGGGSGEQGSYQTPPSYGEQQNYNQQSYSGGGGGGKSGGGIPKFAIIGAGVVVIALLAFFFLREKGGDKPGTSNIAGEWTVFAFQQDEDIATFARDDKSGIVLIFEDDKTMKIINEGNEQTGTWSQEGNKIDADLGEISSFVGELDGEIFIMDAKGFGQFYFNKMGSTISAREKELTDKSILHGTYAELLGTSEEWEEELEEVAEEPKEKEGPKVTEEKPAMSGPVSKPAGEIDTKEDLIGDWVGVVSEMGHYGSKYEGSEMVVYDLIAEIDTDSTGKYYFEAYFLDDTESPLVSAYIEFKDDHFTGDIGEEDAWIADHWLSPEENGLLYAKFDDPTTLYIQYDYEDYEEDNAGYHLSFYFRKVGESWNELPFKPESAK